jgi:UDP-N-acetylglucosamine--N-acetylmuramyl-(pentapeptide) pyrophosphoryl-undecaprenol N-acetylglucosamine transferase
MPESGRKSFLKKNLRMKEKKYMNPQRHKKIIISAGGTGGHIFPALSVANALMQMAPRSEILFVGAEGRMEMERVPAAGYKITGLPVAGFRRSLSFSNIAVLFRLLKSLRMASQIVRDFKPDVAAGFGGYASGPVLRMAGKAGVPTLIQEQNSYAGVTNKLLAKKAALICVAYDGMEKYFPASKIIKTGNPVRGSFDTLPALRDEALAFFGLKPDKPVVLILGGSLGAGTINSSLLAALDRMKSSGIQWLWQTGKNYFDNVNSSVTGEYTSEIKVLGFINRMELAYAAAGVIISRAGAGTISELCLVGKPVILVPSPNVAEDHQTQNAMALVRREAAMLIKDSLASDILVNEAITLCNNTELKQSLSENIKKMADRDADKIIAEKILQLAGE